MNPIATNDGNEPIMHTETVTLDDGRYLIYYTFDKTSDDHATAPPDDSEE